MLRVERKPCGGCEVSLAYSGLGMQPTHPLLIGLSCFVLE